MDILGIILTLVFVIVCYKIYIDYQNDKQNNKTENLYIAQPIIKQHVVEKTPQELIEQPKPGKIKYKLKRSSKNMTKDVSKYLKQMAKFNDDSKKSSIKSAQINPYFQEIQFHQDYRDTINAFGLMCDQKNVFNKSYLPLLKSEKPSESEINGLVTQFISQLNTPIEKMLVTLRLKN
jgi:hypothetical protein